MSKAPKRKPTENPPAYLRYASDNTKTRHFDRVTRSIIDDLKDCSWLQKEPGTLPNNDEILSNFLGNISKNKFKKKYKNIVFFDWILEGEKWVYEPLRSQYTSILENRDEQTRKANKRWNDEKKDAKVMPDGMPEAMPKECLLSLSSSLPSITSTSLSPSSTLTTETLTNPVTKESDKSFSGVFNRPTLSTIADDFQYNLDHEQLAKELLLDVQKEFLLFHDHHTMKATAYANWNSAFNGWLRNAVKYQDKSYTTGVVNGRQGNGKPETAAERMSRHLNQRASSGYTRRERDVFDGLDDSIVSTYEVDLSNEVVK